jgi:hypothetical protein
MSNGDLSHFSFIFEIQVEDDETGQLVWEPIFSSHDFELKFNVIIEGFGNNIISSNYNYTRIDTEIGEPMHNLILSEKETEEVVPRYTKINIDNVGTITYQYLQFPFMNEAAIVAENQAGVGNLYVDANGFVKIKPEVVQP